MRHVCLNAGLKTGCRSTMTAGKTPLASGPEGDLQPAASLDSTKSRLYNAEHHHFELGIITRGPTNSTLLQRQAPMTASMVHVGLANACCSRKCCSLALPRVVRLMIFSSFSSLQLPTRSFVSARAPRTATAACFSSLDF